MKIWIIYDTSYKNNQKVTEMLREELQAKGDVKVAYAKDASPKEVLLDQPDVLLAGGPIRAGMLSFAIRKWVKRFTKGLNAQGRTIDKAGLWVTHASGGSFIQRWAGPASGFATKEMLKVLSLQVKDMKGPLEDAAPQKIQAWAADI